MLNLAAQHPVLYATPRVAFVFCKGVSATVQDALCREGVLVCTPRVIADSLLPASQYLPGVDDYDTQNDAVKFSEMHNNTNSFIGCEDQIKKISSINNYHDDVIGSINGTGEESETFQNENLILLEPCNDLHTNIHSRLRQTIAPFNKEPHENLSPSHCYSTSTSSENNGQFFGCQDDSNVLQKLNTFSHELRNPGSKMHWPMCSNEEIFEMCFELRKYSNKSDLARKAMKSRTFVSLCDNSHFSESNYNRDNLNKTVLSQPVGEQLRTEGRSQAEFPYVESILSSPSCQEPQINQQYARPALENSSESSVVEDHVSSSVDSSEIADSALSKTSMEKQESLKLLLPLNVKLEKNLNLESEPDSIVSAAESAVETIKCSKKLGSSNLCHDIESAVASLCSTNSLEISHHDNSCRKQVCLDVPTMIAYIANTSNGYSHCLFEDKFLRQQALWEQEEPVKPVIEKYWRDCEILVCREALMRFESIVGVMAGEQEIQRAKQLVQRLTIVPDQDVLKGVLRVCGGITVSSRARSTFDE
ncbi:uncharacterized protein LOC108677032 [Hyalella azteca]|uniref:Uncharacterized protein LOC108677032 n=1 Tax=Hyalella azteca TaxID=294128 RepID=A0A8B7P3I1_HYAAZ|nr:uncharacterized protein LOC108677032 [Hyalella azteca]